MEAHEFKPRGDNGGELELAPHDLKLARKLRSAFPQRVRYFLRRHSFGTSYRGELIDPLRVLDYWDGVEHEFEDEELRDRSKPVIASAQDFLLQLAGASGPVGEGIYYAIPTDRELRDDEFEPHTREMIAKVSSTAVRTIREFEDFERYFRKRAPSEFAEDAVA